MTEHGNILGRLEELAGIHAGLEKQLSDPAVVADQQKYREISREYKNSEKVMSAFTAYKSLLAQIADDKEIIASGGDEELAEIARAELEELEQEREKREETVKLLLLPQDANDDKNVIVEIRAGTGGEEAGLFVADIYRMYTRYAEEQRWKIENMSSNPTGIGGFKEIIFMVSGSEVYRRLKFESGVHRVQRVPQTESGGRIHTSAISVAIMPEAEEVDVEINQNDLKIDVYRSSGPGGQSVNTTDSAVRITHLPTGLVVTCQDEKSQHKNRAKAMKILSTRLYDKIRSEQSQARAQNRKLQVGSGDRSEKIRTYNYPQNRITDHRIHYTSHDLDKVMEGELDALLDALLLSYQNEQLAAGAEE